MTPAIAHREGEQCNALIYLTRYWSRAGRPRQSTTKESAVGVLVGLPLCEGIRPGTLRSQVLSTRSSQRAHGTLQPSRQGLFTGQLCDPRYRKTKQKGASVEAFAHRCYGRATQDIGRRSGKRPYPFIPYGLPNLLLPMLRFRISS